MNDEFDAMVGRVVDALLVSADQGSVALVCGAKVFIWATEGDCCSEAWFSDIDGVDDLFGREVMKVERVEMPQIDDGRTRQECDEFYGVKVTTDRGYVDFVFRCSSNGYYGAWMSVSESVHIPTGWSEIRSDWKA